MFLKALKVSTDPCLRSLLQKAARRAHEDVVRRVATRLHELGDRAWLRSRAVVITFEECWPRAADLAVTAEYASREAALVAVTLSVKNKDAAGLGALAWAYHEGDRSMVDLVPDPWALRVVGEGIARPKDYLGWAGAQAAPGDATRVVEAAGRYLAAATWGWDKACILAGAFLAAKCPTPIARPEVTRAPDGSFPLWVALDKHTPDGKRALRILASDLGVSYRRLIWSGFYYESAVVNAMMPSPWFAAERRWRLRKTGLTEEAAARLWERARQRLPDQLSSAVADLQRQSEPQAAALFSTTTTTRSNEA